MKRDSLLGHAGSRPREQQGAVNPPVYHASTVTYPTIEEMREAEKNRLDRFVYGRMGTPTHFAFEEAVAALEGGNHAVVLPSGLGAVSCVFFALVEAGDHVLVPDNAYSPTSDLCRRVLGRLGVETTWYDPLIGEGIRELIRPKTRLVFTESPGSLTFEVQDIPAIAAAAHQAGAWVAMDNTWSAGLYFDAFAHGVDLSVQSGTKYLVGHSDALLGTVTVRERRLFEKLRLTASGMGYATGPDDCYLALRGIRTLAVRMERHRENALHVANWLAQRPEVARVLHPALPSCPGHETWKRDFTGSSGLFSFELIPEIATDDLPRLLNGMELFGIGYSWGGFESLIIPFDVRAARMTDAWRPKGACIRLHVGLEDTQDLLADLEKGLGRLTGAAGKGKD